MSPARHRRPRGVLALGGLLAALCVLAALAPSHASAHAILEDSAPQRGADLKHPPDEVSFHFNEPVETSFGAIRVFDSSGTEVQTGELHDVDGDGSRIAVPLPGDLADGTYTATYRVVSADSHPVSGGFVFSIGRPDDGSVPLSQLLDDGGAGSGSIPFVIDRWLGYAATGLLIGGFAFLLLAWRPALRRLEPEEAAAARAGFAPRMRWLLGLAAGIGLLAALLSLPLQVAGATGVPFGEALSPDSLGEVLGTRFGTLQAVRAVAFALLALLIALAWRPAAGAAAGAANRTRLGRGTLLAAVPPLLALLVVPGLSGHASTQDPTAVLLPADIVHVAAMSVWIGGLASLLVGVAGATARLRADRRSTLLHAALARFSPLALGSVVALALTGALQAIFELGSVPALIETGFGRAVLIKVVLLVGLAVLGYLNRNRIIPRLAELASGARSPGGPGVLLRRNLRLEVGGIAAVLAATAVLVGYAPPAELASGPVSGSVTLGDAYLEYTVDPATVGSNDVHIYLFDADDGTQLDPREVTADATLPDHDVGPIEIDLTRAGPGHYVARGAPFGINGDWTVDVHVRSSRFDEDDARLEVPIG